MNYRNIITLSFLVITIFNLIEAEEFAPISTGRPGRGNPTSAVPTGLYQFEIGTNFTTNQGGIDTSITFPILIRMGLYNNTEWQVGYSNKYLTLGILYGGISIINGFENSIILTASFRGNNDSLIEYSAYIPISYTFQNGFSVLGQVAGTIIDDAENDPIINYSLVIGNNLDDRTNWFFEFNPNEILKLIDNGNNPFSMGYGATFLLDNINTQLDLSMGLTFQKVGSTWVTSVADNYIEWGFSFRLPY